MLFALAALLLVACTGESPDSSPVPQLSDALARMQLVSPVVEQVQSAIVSITAESDTVGPSGVPSSDVYTSYGSGVIFDAGGLVLTNSHVIQNAHQIAVTLMDGSQLEAQIVGADPLSGLAVLRIPGENYPFLPLLSTSEVRLGDMVIAVGNSASAPLGSTIVSAGVVSSLAQTAEISPGKRLYDLIKTDIAVTPRHNGGALVDLSGELVGIIAIGVDGPVAGSFGIGMDTAVPVARQLVLGERPSPTLLSIRPSASECEIASDSAVETGHRATRTPTFDVGVPTSPSNYTSEQIRSWRRAVENAVLQVDGVWSWGIDQDQNRIRFSVYTSYVAEKAREALAETDVPFDAVAFEVDPKRRLDDPPVQINSPIGISISLEFQQTVPAGQPLLIEVVLTNQGDGAAEVEHGTPTFENVIVFTSEGDQVWRKLLGVLIGTGGRTRLEPGEQIRLETLWKQHDLDGFALSPGCYLVRGSMRITDGLGKVSGVMKLATEPHKLVITP